MNGAIAGNRATLGNSGPERIPEIIVVGVGHRSETGMLGLAHRTFDLFPPGSVWAEPGLANDHMKGMGFHFDMTGLQHVYADLIAGMDKPNW